MKLRCVSTKDNYYNGCSITVGKNYDFSEKYDGHSQWLSGKNQCVYIIDDKGYNMEYPKSCFVDIADYREKKLENILNQKTMSLGFTTLKDIRDYMVNYLSNYNLANDGSEYYDDDGYCGDELLSMIKGFWNGFKTEEDFIYVVSGRWMSDDLDLSGGRTYLMSNEKMKTLLFDYMYNRLGWTKEKYEDCIHNSLDITDELGDMFDDLSVIRDLKIENVLETKKKSATKLEFLKSLKKKSVDSHEDALKYHEKKEDDEDEDKYWSNIILKFPMDKKSACDGQENLRFIGYSKLDGDPIYKMNLPRGFEVIKSLDTYLK